MRTVSINDNSIIREPDFSAGYRFKSKKGDAFYEVRAVSRVHYLNGNFRFFVYDVEATYSDGDTVVVVPCFYSEKEFHRILWSRRCRRITKKEEE